MVHEPDNKFTSPVLTNIEAVAFLRLDQDNYADEGAAVRALQTIAREGKITPIRGCGKTFKWHIDELRRYAKSAVDTDE
ncbi:MAG: hypothetical protein IH984_11865 [Planctomycetes bacterium]|nr:hypothetical protein [Planctomycetota bacterium]